MLESSDLSTPTGRFSGGTHFYFCHKLVYECVTFGVHGVQDKCSSMEDDMETLEGGFTTSVGVWTWSIQ